MTIKAVAIDIGILVLVAAAAAGVGYTRGNVDGVAHDNALVLAAQQDTLTAQGNARTASASVLDLKARMAVEQQTLLDAQAMAKAALDQRDALAQQHADDARHAIAADRKAAHESPDCSDLERLPLCPVLAHRLFGDPPTAAPAGASGTGGDRPPGAGVSGGG